mgnify:CR=1 FL=1
MRPILPIRTWWLLAALAWALVGPGPAGGGAAATPAAMAGLLRTVERDVGAMSEHVSMMRGRLGEPIDGEGPGARVVGIADGGFLSTVRSLHQASLRIERRLEQLKPRLRQLDESRAGEIVLAMRVELSTLTLALGDLAASEDPLARAQALDQLGRALAALEGATAAVWTLGP